MFFGNPIETKDYSAPTTVLRNLSTARRIVFNIPGIFTDVVLTLYWVFSIPLSVPSQTATKISGSGKKAPVQLVHSYSGCSFYSATVAGRIPYNSNGGNILLPPLLNLFLY